MFEVAFMVFGLGFFLFVIWLIQTDEERRYQRKLNEMREFGYQKQKRKDRQEFLKDMEP